MINHWWTTRPKRKLITIVDVLRVFLAVAEGKQWTANRNLHLKFEEGLEKSGVKREGERRDQQAGGGRTYAAWLFSFGLWFADSEGLVRTTFAGEDLIKLKSPVPILTKQILDFQYPSPFSQITDVDPRFKIFPFRFLLKLLLDARLEGKISKKEIARIVITQAETDSDFGAVIEGVLSYRQSGGNDDHFDAAFQERYGKLSKLDDVANTFINQLEYTQLISRESDDGSIFIPADRIEEVRSLVASQPPLILRVDDEYEFFQRKYGLGPHHQRDNRTFGRTQTVTAQDTERSAVLLALSNALAYTPMRSITPGIISQISERSGVNEREAERIIASLGVQPDFDVFEAKYLQLAVGGTAFAREFEQATAGVFGLEGLGFTTEWIGAHPNNPDVLALSLEGEEQYTGILDAKAYSEYSLIGDHRRRMVHVYIPKYASVTRNGRDLPLAFFSYVAGGFTRQIDSSISAVATETDVSGSCITAQELLQMLKRHRTAPYSKADLKRIFTLNRRLLPTDFSE